MSDVILDARDLKVHFALRGGFLQRLTGMGGGSIKAVDGVSFQLRRGEVLGLVGESGSGKTTLGRTVVRLTRPTSGSLLLDGEDISRFSERAFRPYRRRVQMIFQDPRASLNPSMALLEAVGHPLRIHGVTNDRATIRARVSAALETVGLTPVEQFLSKYPSDLSGGQNQRAALARAIILGPELLVADEPVSMLDMSVRAKVLELMLSIKRELSLTYLYITHDLATAKFFCDRIAIMYLGRVVEIGPAADIYAKPRHPYTVSLLKAIPEPDPRKQVTRDLPRGEVPDAARPPAGCSFHPRCPRAFAPCGWEPRDLRLVLEQRWTSLQSDQYQREQKLVGDLDRLATDADHRAALGTSQTSGELTQLLTQMRNESRGEPFWRGVTRLEDEGSHVALDFHDRVDPPLLPIQESPVSVACHLYDPRLRDLAPDPPDETAAPQAAHASG